MNQYRESILRYAEKQRETYLQIARELHARPETCNREFFACQRLSDQLKAEGFEVTVGIAGHPTGFLGTYKAPKPGPVIAFMAEYDALEGLGHACGHNLFGPTSLLAGACLRQVIDETGGEVRVYGCPGEEGGINGSAKATYVREGLFDGVDAALCTHPGSHVYEVTTESLALSSVDIEFHGRASHAAAAPEKGINALDAVILVYNGINALRQHMTDDVRIHGIITHGGDAPNIVPAYASARFYLRAATAKGLETVYARVEDIVRGAALATGCTGGMKEFQNRVYDTVLLPSFDALYAEELLSLGFPTEPGKPTPLGSTDVGNVSHILPTIQPMIRISDTPVAGHSVEKKTAACGKTGLNSVVIGGKALALTALRLITEPETLANIKAEHAKKTN